MAGSTRSASVHKPKWVRIMIMTGDVGCRVWARVMGAGCKVLRIHRRTKFPTEKGKGGEGGEVGEKRKRRKSKVRRGTVSKSPGQMMPCLMVQVTLK